jgi:hypothetical protein
MTERATGVNSPCCLLPATIQGASPHRHHRSSRRLASGRAVPLNAACMKAAIASSVSLAVWLAGLTALPTGTLSAQTETNQPRGLTNRSAPNLPVMILEAKGTIGRDEKVECSLKMVPPEGSAGGGKLLAGTVRFHGSTSQAYPKKSYAITLNEPARLLDLSHRAHWILNAAYIDRSLMRHKLSYDLFQSLASERNRRVAASSRFIELQLDGNYHGVYLLMERLDGDLLGFRPFRSNEVSQACLYKAIDHAANFGQPGHGGYEQREPDPLVLPYSQPLDELNRFVSTAPAAAFFDPKTGIESRLDLDNAIDFHLLVLLTSNSDGITKNFFIGRDAPGTNPPAPRFLFAPWDYDGTFGRNWNATPFPAGAWLSNHLFERLMSEAAYRARFLARWKQLREGQFSTQTVQAMMDANVRTLGAAAQRNLARWPTTGWPYPDRVTFDQDIAQMKSWIQVHLKWLDQEIKRRADQP